MWTVRAFGRKSILVVGFLGQAISFTILCGMVYMEWYPLLYPICMIYIVSHGIGATASMPWRVETIPSAGLSINMAIGWMNVSLVGQLTPILTDGWPGPLGLMIFFTLVCYVGVLWMYTLVIETKGKQTDEIEIEYLEMVEDRFDKVMN